jgi:hypothetical protein
MSLGLEQNFLVTVVGDWDVRAPHRSVGVVFAITATGGHTDTDGSAGSPPPINVHPVLIGGHTHRGGAAGSSHPPSMFIPC